MQTTAPRSLCWCWSVSVRLSVLLLLMLVVSAVQTRRAIALCLFSCERARCGSCCEKYAICLSRVLQPESVCWEGMQGMKSLSYRFETGWKWKVVVELCVCECFGKLPALQRALSKFTHAARGLCACRAKIRPKTITLTARNSKFSFHLAWF